MKVNPFRNKIVYNLLVILVRLDQFEEGQFYKMKEAQKKKQSLPSLE